MPITWPGGGSGSGSGGSRGSTSGGVKWPGAGSGSSSRGRGKSKPISQKRQLIMVASRVARIKGPQREYALKVLGDAMAGMSQQKIYRLGNKAGIAPADIDKVVAGAESPGPELAKGGNPFLLDLLDRPVQTVKGAVVESGGLNPVEIVKGDAFSGAWKGLSGKEKYSGSETVGAVATQSEEGGKKFAESLPGPVRVGVDFAVDTALDPTNYVTLGGGPLAENAAKAAAKTLAEDAATRAGTAAVGKLALGKEAQDIYERILARGAKGLTEAERAALPKALVRRLNKAQGGVYFAGRKLPGSQKLAQAVRHRGVQDGGILGSVEQSFRTEAATRQAERAGEVVPGTTGLVEQTKEAIRATDTAAGLARKNVEKRAEFAVGQVVKPGASERATIRAGRKAIDKAAKEKGNLDLDAVFRSLDVGGGKAAIDALPDAEKALARELRDILDQQAAEKIAAGRIMDTPTAQQVLGAEAARPLEQAAAKVEPRILQLEERRLAAEQRIAAVQQRVDVLDAERAATRGAPTKQASRRWADAHRILEREKARLAQVQRLKDQAERRMSRTLVRGEQKRTAAAAGVVPQDEYIPHYTISYDGKPKFRGRGASASEGIPGRAAGFTKRRTRQMAAADIPTDQFGRPVVETNPVVAVGRSASDTTKDLGRAERFQELAAQSFEGPGGTKMPLVKFGDEESIAAIKRADPNWKESYVEMRQPVSREVDGRIVSQDEPVLVHKAIAKDFQRVIEAQADNHLMQGIKYLNSMWARWATATTGFISRNVLQGNLYMGMVLAEARDPRVWADTLGMFKRINRGMARWGDPLRYMKGPEKELVQSAIDHGVISSGFYDDLAQRIARETEGHPFLGSRANPLSPQFYPVERISAANQWAENWSRLSVYRNKIKQGFTPAEAAQITDHYMLNYRNLSPVNEKLRLVNPFLTWVYKSTPMLLGEAARAPRKVMIPLAAANAIGAEGSRDLGADVFPRWQREGGAVPIPGEVPLVGGQMFMPDTPIHSASDAVQPGILAAQILANQVPGLNRITPDPGPNAWSDMAREADNTLSPGGVLGGGGRSIVEAATGQQLFSGREYTPGEQVPMPIVGGKVPYQVRLLAENLLPIVGRASTFAPQTDYERKAQGRRIVSAVGGVGVYPYNKSTRDAAYRERIAELEALIRKVRDEGGRVPRTTRKVSSSGSGGVQWPG